MKSFLHMRWRNIFYAPLFILLIVSMTITGVSANPTHVYVDPPTVTIEALGENATIAINVSQVSNVHVYEFWLNYDTTLLDALEVTIGPVAPGLVYLQPRDPATDEWKPIYDEEGLVKVVVTLLDPSTFTDSGTLAYITFNGTAAGTSVLELIDEHTNLYNPDLDTIPSSPVDGEIVVIPEFPAILVTPLLLIATLAAALLRKKFWSRKRRDSATA